MTKTETFTRIFSQSRKEQGFKSQAHLDAFYAAYDHTNGCTECQTAGTPYETTDGGFQPTRNRCEVARQLDAARFAF